ncbi:MAG TPA: NADH-quinone oxidoreductase subunit NuoG [Casimicrobiaceae bacterium]|nr:NADH-quinone oxidoreductase subunit NuoG [Casimicrobiaceae bacterium]
MLNLEVDGKPVQVPAGSTVMDATNKLGVYVPHFCYHKKLTIAANCRMCLVQVEKAPKPLPACATPATEGMKVFTHSELAVDAQKGVMEFLLINHPLDCPICDQGGECQLQDLAVGYGASQSRYDEPKRVVFEKYLGPLISAAEMTRCIHCTRCVRFGQEIAGVMELGMAGRGEHAEIMTFVGQTVDSELSGNMIDLCPVGALTSKPFRYSARTWELSRRKSVAPHDSLGSNVIVQVKGNDVMRVLPLENESVNECWLSDKDRFSYEALDSSERLTSPLINEGGTWVEVNWASALERVALGLKSIVERHGPTSIGALVSPHSTLEELTLAARLMRGLGSDNIDYRLRQTDFRADQPGARWLGMQAVELNTLDRVLVIGSFLRNDHPLIAQRLRQAAKQKARIMKLSAVDDDWLMPIAHKAIVQPSLLPAVLADIIAAAAHAVGKPIPHTIEQSDREVQPEAQAIATELASGERRAILLGNLAEQHPDASQIHALAQALADLTGATLGFFRDAANSVGADIAQARPLAGGLNAQSMIADPRRAYLVLNAEAEFDFANPVATRAALERAEMVVVMSPFKHGAAYADVMLPIAPFSETSGTFVNCEGRVQSFRGSAPPRGETRPGWKVLRVLGTMLGLPGFDLDSSAQVRDGIVPPGSDISSRLDNRTNAAVAAPSRAPAATERAADIPIYFADALVRRAPSLQKTRDARPPRARAHRSLLDQLGIESGAPIRIRQGNGEAVIVAEIDATVPPGVIRLGAAHPSTCSLDGLSGPVTVERA